MATRIFTEEDERDEPGSLAALYSTEAAIRDRKTWRMVTASEVTFALRLIDESGIAPALDAWRLMDAPPLSSGGRKACMTHRQILAVWLLATRDAKGGLLLDVAEILAYRLDPTAQLILGINSADADIDTWYDRAWRATRRALQPVDGFPGPRRRALSNRERQAVFDARDAHKEMYERRILRLEWVAAALLHATTKLIPRRHRRHYKGDVSTDATVMQVPTRRGTDQYNISKGKPPRQRYVTEYDADWATIHPDSRNRHLAVPRNMAVNEKTGEITEKNLFVWGYDLHATVMTSPAGSKTGRALYPNLVLTLGITKPGKEVAVQMTRSLQAVQQRWGIAGFASADRAYFPGQDVEKLHAPIREAGFSVVTDYRIDQLGRQGGYAGAIQVEGRHYCPMMPLHLQNATKDLRNKKLGITNGEYDPEKADADYQALIAERQYYELQAKESPDAHGNQKMMCPAKGPNPTVTCVLEPRTFTGTKANLMRKRPTIYEKHPDPDRICTNKSSVTLPFEAGLKYRQELRYGSKEWRRAYRKTRNTIEGLNSYVKNGATGGLRDTSRRLLRGRTAQFFIALLLVAAANIKRIENFLHRESQPDPAPRKRLPHSRRWGYRTKRRNLDHLNDAKLAPDHDRSSILIA